MEEGIERTETEGGDRETTEGGEGGSQEGRNSTVTHRGGSGRKTLRTKRVKVKLTQRREEKSRHLNCNPGSRKECVEKTKRSSVARPTSTLRIRPGKCASRRDSPAAATWL